MGLRIDLHDILKTLLGSDNVYFQPPPSTQMVYPCIVYKLDNIIIRHGSNKIHLKNKAYQVTVIDRNPDSSIPNSVLNLPKSRFNRFYTADNLNHFVFNIFF